MERLKLHWLGQPLIELKGQSVKLETRKAAAMLAYLSLTPGACQREVLATMFWPEGNQQKSLANLRRTLSSLNSSLPKWIEANRETISLKRNAKLWVDIEAFDDLLSRYKEHSHPDSEICKDCLSALDQAIELYRGDFLKGLNLTDSPGFDEWQFFQRDSLRQEFATALQCLSSIYALQDDWDHAIVCARRWRALDYLHEPACRLLMDLYARSGQRTAALRQYEELARLLQEQLRQKPEQETRQLYEQILGKDKHNQVRESPEYRFSFPLLKTKLYIPAAPAHRVNRTRLIKHLDEIDQHALTVISAPAGFGKTTLLSEWITQSMLPVAWLSLDNGDNDPYRFLAYLIEALESVHEDVGLEARQIIQSPQLVPVHIILASLINNLGSVGEPSVLVLDDYQFLTEHAVHDAMTYLLDHLPSNLHVVIAARADPPLQLGRLRAHGQMLELRTQDLRFTSDEAAEFLNEVMQLGLSTKDIDALEARTEGWVAGLQMAALSLRGHENASEFIQAFSGSHRYVLDYLMEEVLRRQLPHIQTFLLETSILEKLNGVLCDAIMSEEWKQSGESGQAVLEYLERNNLFLIPLDDHKQWYRYHHLFADLLQSRLQQFSADRAVALHLSASRWFEVQGLLHEAINHALLSKDYHRSAKLLDISSQTRVLIDVFSVQKWIQEIPDEIICEHPWIHVSQAWIWLSMGKLEKIEASLIQVDEFLRSVRRQSMDDREREDILGHVAMLRAYLAFFRGEPLTTIKQATLALQNVRLSNNFLRSRIMLQLGESYSVLGELQQGTRYLYQAIDLSVKEADYSVATVAYFRLGNVLKVQGKLREAEKMFQQNLLALRELGGQTSPMLGKPEIGLGDVFREQGQLDAARELLSIGHKHSQLQGQPYDLVYSYIYMARLFEAQGRRKQVPELLSQVEPLFVSYTNPPAVRLAFECYRVNVWLRLGKLGKAADWVAENRLDCHTDINYMTEQKLISLARLLIAQARLNEAQDLLIRLAASAEAGSRIGRLLEILVLQALASQAAGNMHLACEILLKSVQLAEPE
ncbi:MAG TPA: BTAD domain-containing putative transcriptional regulator, partial [Anaerolineales bacterium]|nr:BTAD domain-containing putative transcriptional regulator [Anaerolineales bacterium]